MKALKIRLTDAGRRYKRDLAMLGLSSRETIRAGLKAVDASPFNTVFVVDEKSGTVLCALSTNAEYVKRRKKKKKTPPPPPESYCCQMCYASGGYACDDLGDGSCICYGQTGSVGGVGPDDLLSSLAP